MFCGIDEEKRGDQNREDCKKIENYIFRAADKVGEGNFSQVFRGVDQQTGKYVAIKVVKYSSLNSKMAEQLLKNEVAILNELNHENVLKCHEVLSSKNHCYIITEYYEGGDLQKMLHRNKMFQEREIAKIIYDVYKGLIYLNELGIVHRDFKLANIFVTASGTPKIADFGFAIKASQPFKDINIGSPIYMSPQGLLLHQYGPKTDVWAFGIMIYELLHGDTPLASCRSEKQLKQKILLPPIFRQGISSQLKKLIDICLTVDPKHRVSMKDIANTPYMIKLMHEFDKVKASKDLASTYHTDFSKVNHALSFMKDIKTYQEGLAILQYCRLVHKTAQLTSSLVLSQWLLNICWNLNKIKLSQGDKERNQKLMTTIRDYYAKYQKQHVEHHMNVSPQEIMQQCEKLGKSVHSSLNRTALKKQTSNLVMLSKQTEMLHKCVQANKFSYYVKNTQIEKYLDSIKHSSKHGVTPGAFSINYTK